MTAAPMRVPTHWPTPTKDWPEWLWTVPYDGKQHPQAEVLLPVADGANCQRYAYAVLELFGRRVPGLRSSELWDDPGFEHVEVVDLRPLDLVLFNAERDAFGAHVGVHVAEDEVLHLCAEMGTPTVWNYGDFAARDHYRHVLGGIRIGRDGPDDDRTVHPAV